MGIISFLTAVYIAASSSVFAPSEHFVVNTDADAIVRIMYINDAFHENFSNFNEGPEKRHFLRKYQVDERSYNADIITELTGPKFIEVSLRDVWSLLSLQPKGGAGELSNFTDNIFYVRDGKDKLWSLLVKWEVSGWYIGAFSPDSGTKIEKGSFVFIRRN